MKDSERVNKANISLSKVEISEALRFNYEMNE